jgi:hypothetical protein
VTGEWELRTSRRFGSEHAGFFPSQDAAETEAVVRIIRAGEVGRITLVDAVAQIVYMDEYEEDS